MNRHLFKKVKCNAYLKKIHEDKFIDVDQDNLIATYVSYKDGEEVRTDSCCEGDLDFLKTYYNLEYKKFTGFVVGFREVTSTAYLVADINYSYMGSESISIKKIPNNTYRCAIVYYGNNRKRFVPVENMELITEVEHGK